MKRVAWTREELQALIPVVEKRLEAAEAEQAEEVRGLPPMTPDECLEYFWRLMDAAAVRPLSQRECFLHGQLLSNFRMAVFAEARGYKGRFYVIQEEQIAGLLASNGPAQTPQA